MIIYYIYEYILGGINVKNQKLINENIKEVERITEQLKYYRKVNDLIFLKYYVMMAMELLFSMVDVVKVIRNENTFEEIELFESNIDLLVDTINLVCENENLVS